MFLLKWWSSSGRIFSQIWWYSKYESKKKKNNLKHPFFHAIVVNFGEMFSFKKQGSIYERVFFLQIIFQKMVKIHHKNINN